jgi:hypothetical protein
MDELLKRIEALERRLGAAEDLEPRILRKDLDLLRGKVAVMWDFLAELDARLGSVESRGSGGTESGQN